MSQQPHVSPSSLVADLEKILREFGTEAADAKRSLLDRIGSVKRMPARALAHLQDCLCFLQAYPDNARVHKAAVSLVPRLRHWLALLPDAEETAALADQGFPGAVNRHPFSYNVLRRMAARHPRCFEIEWEECEDEGPIQNALVLLVSNNECQGLDDIRLTMSSWAQACKANPDQSDLDLLLRIFEHAPLRLDERAYLYDSCSLPIRYELADPDTGRCEIRLETPRIHYQKQAISRKRFPLERSIRKELEVTGPLPKAQGEALIHVAQRALCARNLEIASLIYAHAEDCFLITCDRGLRVGLIGVAPEMRDTLESSYFFVILKNEIPIAYGPASISMGCCEMGINLFPEYRGGEIHLIYAQFMRVLHQVLGVQYYYLTSYGMGEGNLEAIRTGAFWFYRKLGFRAENADVELLAQEEEQRMAKQPGYRSDRKMLRRLSHTDAFFDISDGACQRLDLGAIGLAQSRFIAREFDGNRGEAIRCCVEQVAAQLSIGDLATWSAPRRRALELYAPLLCLLPDLESWTRKQKSDLLRIIKSKGSRSESQVDQLLLQHKRLRSALLPTTPEYIGSGPFSPGETPGEKGPDPMYSGEKPGLAGEA